MTAVKNCVSSMEDKSMTYSQPIISTSIQAIQPAPVSPSSYHVLPPPAKSLEDSSKMHLRFEESLHKLKQMSVDDTVSTAPYLTTETSIATTVKPKTTGSNSPNRSHFPFFRLPAEIRIKIYQAIYISSRLQPMDHNVPDFAITKEPLRPIRWLNIPNLNLPIMLASQKLADEFIPAISSLVFFQLPISRDLSTHSTETSDIQASLRRTEIICVNATKILISFYLPKVNHHRGTYPRLGRPLLHLWHQQALYYSELLATSYEKLKEVEVKISVRDMPKEGMCAFSPLLGLAAKKGVNVALVLEVERDDWRTMLEEKRCRKGFEKVIFREGRRVAGVDKAIWVQWVGERDSRD